ncbi:aspartate/glutamate racemase family protein [Methylocapsa sp. S129]|uniref:maleate cis-trans isomerase family protein n=1 Tax=Methylocapsa sp. S129 TaxID=1641869 RepID=UPI00131B14F8|nr:aspartate/glutamate racemase family protein [Methylocapsa sp. S129]
MSVRRIAPAEHAIGVILPSSNRVVERVTLDVLRLLPEVDACFARIPYFGNGQGQPADRYEEEPFLAASELLAQARVSVICWNATRGAALGFDHDRALSARIKGRTGLPVVTTALAALDAFHRFGISRIALVTHGASEQGAAFKARFQAQGIATHAELHLGFEDNFAAAQADPGRIIRFSRESAAQGNIDAVLIWSTNLPGHAFAAALEKDIGAPVLDSAAIGVWAALGALNIDTRPAASLGRLFG